jgi:hypothetical protein
VLLAAADSAVAEASQEDEDEVVSQINVAAAKFFDGDSDAGDVALACWSLVHGLSALIVDGRLAEYDTGPAEAVATRLTRLLSDSLSALGDRKPGGTQSNGDEHSLRKRRSVKPVDSLTAG